MLKLQDLPYLETVNVTETHTVLGATTSVSVDASGEALGDITLVEVDLSAHALGHEQGSVAVGTGIIHASAHGDEASIAAQLEAEALARVSRKHSGHHSVSTGSDVYTAAFVVVIATD